MFVQFSSYDNQSEARILKGAPREKMSTRFSNIKSVKCFFNFDFVSYLFNCSVIFYIHFIFQHEGLILSVGITWDSQQEWLRHGTTAPRFCSVLWLASNPTGSVTAAEWSMLWERNLSFRLGCTVNTILAAAQSNPR